MTDDEIEQVYNNCHYEFGDTAGMFACEFARAIIAAYQAKLIHGVGEPIGKVWKQTEEGHSLLTGDHAFTIDQVAAVLLRGQEVYKKVGYLRGLEECLEICNRLTDKNMHSADCAAAIDKLKGE